LALPDAEEMTSEAFSIMSGFFVVANFDPSRRTSISGSKFSVFEVLL